MTTAPLTGSAAATADYAVYDDIYLHLTPENFYFEPVTRREVLMIDRITNVASVVQLGAKRLIPETASVRKVCGLLGMIRITSGWYLVVATHRVYVGVINGQVLWRLAGFDLIPYTSMTHLTEAQKQQNEVYLDMIRTVLDTPYYYFSYTYDLSHSLQRLYHAPPDFMKQGLLERADMRFVWNGYMLKGVNKPDMKRYCLPLVHGFVSIHQVNVNGHFISFVLISRRSTQRAGPRWFSRGINRDGFVSNYVETEQIVEYDNERVSFVQTRGSIPLFWRQWPSLKYKPPVELDYDKDHQTACIKHLDSQLILYGRQVLVNLIDHRGFEEILEKRFRALIAEVANPQNVRYEAFDFHTECRKMRWDRLNILIDRLAHEQDEFGYFHLTKEGKLLSSQDGVFRTNCIDCLDRTNVVQSMLARRSLTQALTKLGVLFPGQRAQDVPVLEGLFRNVWADNADLISIQYSGTGALKTDFTRTGKRSLMGALKDGMNSITRYYKNNFNDGFRQDAIDLFLGNYRVEDGEGAQVPSPLQSKQKDWRYVAAPAVLLFAVAMFFSSMTLPQDYNSENLLYLMFWGSMVGFTGMGILKYGIEFVDWPRLVPPPKPTAKKF